MGNLASSAVVWCESEVEDAPCCKLFGSRLTAPKVPPQRHLLTEGTAAGMVVSSPVPVRATRIKLIYILLRRQSLRPALTHASQNRIPILYTNTEVACAKRQRRRLRHYHCSNYLHVPPDSTVT
jgi:hypothetical protein